MRYVKLIDADTVLHEQRKLIQRKYFALKCKQSQLESVHNQNSDVATGVRPLTISGTPA